MENFYRPLTPLNGKSKISLLLGYIISLLTVAGETLVACVKFGVDSDESKLLFDL